jgi:hypothetical protein
MNVATIPLLPLRLYGVHTPSVKLWVVGFEICIYDLDEG